MGTLLTRTIRFGVGTTTSTIVGGRIAHAGDKVDSPPRVFKALIYNEGEYPITVTLEGSVDNNNWTTRATASSVKAKSSAVLTGSVRGQEAYYRWRGVGVGGDSYGQIEIFDESDALVR